MDTGDSENTQEQQSHSSRSERENCPGDGRVITAEAVRGRCPPGGAAKTRARPGGGAAGDDATEVLEPQAVLACPRLGLFQREHPQLENTCARGPVCPSPGAGARPALFPRLFFWNRCGSSEALKTC